MLAPPVATVYQRYWPLLPPLAESVALAAEHNTMLATVGGVTVGLIVAVTAVLVLSHVPLLMET